MREIKFRAWDESIEKMLYNSEGEYPFVSDPRFIKVVNDGVLFADAPDMSHYGGGDWSYIDGEFKIMQYTGLKDKNEKDIYEGDIVDVSRYENEERYFVVIKDIRDLPDLLFGSALNSREVVGNTHEHPEFFKEGYGNEQVGANKETN